MAADSCSSQAGLFKDLKSFVKGLDFKAAGATQPADDSEDEIDEDGQGSDEAEEDDALAGLAPAK